MMHRRNANRTRTAALAVEPPSPRSRHAHLHGRTCPSCGYDLRTAEITGAELCTECGQSLDPTDLDAAEERRLFRKVTRIVVLVSIVLFLVSLLVNFLLAGYGQAGADAMVYIAPALVFLIGPIAPVLLALFAAKNINRRHPMEDRPPS
jgi:hypothetical protein